MKNTTSLAAICFLLVLLFASCGDNGTAVVSDTAAVKDSLAIINDQIRNDPNNADLYYQRAMYYTGKKDFAAAIMDINRVISIDSNNVKYLMAAADIHFFTNKVQRADQLLKRAVEIEPTNVDCMLRLAQLHHYLKRYEEEMALLEKVLDIDKRNSQAFFMKGMIYKEKGDTANAMQTMQLAVQMDPDYYNAYIQLGLLAAAQHNPLAIDYYRNALEIKPASEEALYNLGMYYQESEQYDMAINVYKSILQLDPVDFDSHFNMGVIYTEYLDSLGKAMENFNLAIRDNPQDPRGYFGRGKCYEKQGNITSATMDYKKALELDPQYTSAALALERMSKRPGAN